MPDRSTSPDMITGFVINLDTAVDRRAHMEQVGAYFDIPLTFFTALTPTTLPERWRSYFYDDQGRPWADLKPGEIACYASHLEVMSQAVERNQPIVIAEDDLRPLVDAIAIRELLASLPDGWGFVRLSGIVKSPAMPRGTELIETTRQPNNMGLYLVSPLGARRFIEYSSRRFRAIDEDLRRVWEHGAVNYCTPSPWVEINIFDSNIDAAGDRGDLPERKRTRLLGPSPLQVGWQKLCWCRQRFGVTGCVRLMLNYLTNKFRKKSRRSWVLE
ncbi:glycosyltransferase family 25 protein [Marinobacterium marinum]|uniref:Glycosyltransferase family 25 protein n=1 Tax=Marinobacterium marinum TaxID=2756129 RepID=A0A7W1WWL9_9GAMM|nr:glycosyltransferase family 25 protein [Marinobacterium marinum]MBA4501503.1 glycosyltransferase family 25 protein [Marinobacterium marinum]